MFLADSFIILHGDERWAVPGLQPTQLPLPRMAFNPHLKVLLIFQRPRRLFWLPLIKWGPSFLGTSPVLHVPLCTCYGWRKLFSLSLGLAVSINIWLFFVAFQHNHGVWCLGHKWYWQCLWNEWFNSSMFPCQTKEGDHLLPNEFLSSSLDEVFMHLWAINSLCMLLRSYRMSPCCGRDGDAMGKLGVERKTPVHCILKATFTFKEVKEIFIIQEYFLNIFIF